MSMMGRFFVRTGARMLGWDAGDQSRMREDLGWGKMMSSSEDYLLKDGTLGTIRQKCFDLRRNTSVVPGVCERLALFSCGSGGVIPQCRTSDKGWNRAAEQWWMETFSETCDSRGRASLLDFQRMAISLRPTHGGIYFHKQVDGTLRPIETERIRNPQKPDVAVGWTDGVLYDKKSGRILKYCAQSRDKDGLFSGPRDEIYIDASEIIPAVTPPWRPDQIREIPDFAPIVPALQDITKANEYTLNTMKWQSSIMAFLKRLAPGKGMGLSPRNTGIITGSGVIKRKTFNTCWGEVLEGLPGEDLDLKTSNTPNSTHIPYMKFQLALVASALSMPYEFFTLDMQNLDYSRMKGVLLLINYAIRPWRKWVVDDFLRPVWAWRIAKEAARPRSELSPLPEKANGESDWNHVDWQGPEELWIDRQEAQQADVLEIQAGMNTLGGCLKRRGRDLEETLYAKADEEDMIQRIAKERGISPEKLSFMQIPGQVMENQRKDEPESKPKKETEE